MAGTVPHLKHRWCSAKVQVNQPCVQAGQAATASCVCVCVCVCVCAHARVHVHTRTWSFSHVRLFVILWTVAYQGPLSMGFSKQEYWSGLHGLLQGIFPTQGSNSCLSKSPALASRFFTTSTTWEGIQYFHLADEETET